MNVVIDTNVFVSSFLSLQGPPKRVIDLWKTGRIILCLSRDIIAEYVEVLARFGLAGQPELRELLDLFARRVNIIFVAPLLCCLSSLMIQRMRSSSHAR